MHLTTNNPPSLGLILTSFEEGEEVCEEELLGGEGEECSISTSLLGFKILLLFVG